MMNNGVPNILEEKGVRPDTTLSVNGKTVIQPIRQAPPCRTLTHMHTARILNQHRP